MEKITTPIFDFLEKYKAADSTTANCQLSTVNCTLCRVRAHMPGHKGRDVFGKGLERLFEYDITEIKGADELFEAEGIIAESEKNASRLFGTAATFYSAGGSTLCIQAMLAAVCKKSSAFGQVTIQKNVTHGNNLPLLTKYAYKGKGSAFICGRTAHRSVMNSCVLLGLEPCWVYPEYEEGSAVSGEITPEAVRTAIEENAYKKPACVFITSPDYLGKIADIKGISEVCHESGIPLIVDNAHGAYLAFTEQSRHPIHMGADMCCDSAHKTLPVLTGGAYLHIGDGLCEKNIPEIKRCMALFGSSSPSYLIMASMDLCNKYLSESFRDDLKITAEKISEIKKQLCGVYSFYGDEPLKMTVYAFPCGLTGYELAERLREGGVEPEYADLTHVVMMFSTANTDEDFDRVLRAMKSVRMPRIRLEPPDFEPDRPAVKMLPREAFFAERETVPAEKSLGRIAAEAVTVCPPCVPVIMAGEEINENTIKILKNYSIFQINVLK